MQLGCWLVRWNPLPAVGPESRGVVHASGEEYPENVCAGFQSHEERK